MLQGQGRNQVVALRIPHADGHFAAGLGAGTSFAADVPSGRELGELYGFLPVEIYKLENRISNLTLADLDGDKIDDVIVSNNGRSRFDILYSDPRIVPDKEETDQGVNTPTYDKRMRARRYPVGKEIVSVVAADFDGDGRKDLAYYGRPAGIVILRNEGQGKFAAPIVKELGEGVSAATSLATGDLNRDGRADLVLLRDSELVILPQIAGGKFGDPIRLGHAAQRPRLLKLSDVDGDGGDDVILFSSSEVQPVHLRLSLPKGESGADQENLTLGAERRLKMEQIRAIGFANLDDKPGQEWMVVDNSTGRGHVMRLRSRSGNGSGPSDDADALDRFGALFDYPLPSTDSQGRSMDTGDLDGDGLAEAVVSDPEAARVITFRRGRTNTESFDSVRHSPSLIGVRSIRIGDLDGDGKAEVYVLSEKEKQIGRGVWRDGRLSFPAPLPLVSGEPISFELADIDGDRKPELVYAVRTKVDGKDRLHLQSLKCDAKGNFSVCAWPGGVTQVALKEASVAPERIQAIDVNDDGSEDLLLTSGYGSPTLFVSRKGAAPLDLANLGPLASANRSSVRMALLDGKRTLMVAHNKFARVVGLDSDNRWQIRDQFNASSTSASIQGVTTLNLDGNAQSDLALYDQDNKSIEILLRDERGARSAGIVPLGNLEFHGIRSGDFGGDGRPDLLVEGAGRFSVLVAGATSYVLERFGSYETTDRRSRLGDVVSADFGGPVGPEIAWIDIGEHSIHLTTLVKKSEAETELRPALNFEVFEEKSFRDVRSLGEPRDAAAGDVNGDGLSDLVLIAHDRILIYRQDSGTTDKPDQKPAAADAGATIEKRSTAGGEGASR